MKILRSLENSARVETQVEQHGWMKLRIETYGVILNGFGMGMDPESKSCLVTRASAAPHAIRAQSATPVAEREL